MNKETNLQKLTEIITNMDDCKEKNALLQYAGEVNDTQSAIGANLDHLKLTLDDLRVKVKYLLFDLEATRRENSYLRKMLETENDD